MIYIFTHKLFIQWCSTQYYYFRFLEKSNKTIVMAGDKKAGQFKLRAVLQGHSMDVKQVTAVSEPSGALLTASRDKTAR